MREELREKCHMAFKEILDASGSGWIAGGALRDWFARVPTTSDIDVFFISDFERRGAAARIQKISGTKSLYDHEHVQGFMVKGRHVQLIKKKFFESPEETIAQFDFTVCCVAMNASGEVCHHGHFFEDLAGRRLAINSLPFPLSTLERLQKYVAKGFKACNGTLLEISKAIAAVDFSDPSANVLSFYPNKTPRFERFD